MNNPNYHFDKKYVIGGLIGIAVMLLLTILG